MVACVRACAIGSQTIEHRPARVQNGKFWLKLKTLYIYCNFWSYSCLSCLQLFVYIHKWALPINSNWISSLFITSVTCCSHTVYSQLCLCILTANDLGMWSSYKHLHHAEFLRHVKITKEKVVSSYSDLHCKLCCLYVIVLSLCSFTLLSGYACA